MDEVWGRIARPQAAKKHVFQRCALSYATQLGWQSKPIGGIGVISSMLDGSQMEQQSRQPQSKTNGSTLAQMS
ncbi:MAG TPA: hypothetical protein DEF45_12640 [Rhodopirellula sp.]|nr:hypothetical protein [Rhodopirellula sp.]